MITRTGYRTKMKNRSQAAFEFIILAGVMMAVFVVFYAVVGNEIIEMSQSRTDIVAQDIIDTVIAEIEIAQQSLDGYSRVFVMPDYVEGNPYEITINSIGEMSVVSLLYQGETYNYEIPVKVKRASRVYKGENTITKGKEGILIVNEEDPCKDVGLTLVTNKYCIGGECYCTANNYAPDGECTHENDRDLDCTYDCVAFDYCNPPPAIKPGETGTVTTSPGNPPDSKEYISFTTNESAKATISYDEADGFACLDFSKTFEETSFGLSHNILLEDLHADTLYCFRITVEDKKGAAQYYDTSRLPLHTFTTAADQSPPLVRYAEVYPHLADIVPYHVYDEEVEIFANITDESPIDWSSTKAIIRQREEDGSYTEGWEYVLDDLDDVDSDCAQISGVYVDEGTGATALEEVYDDDGYLQCFWTDNIFAKKASYGGNDENVLFYASFDDSAAAEVGGNPLASAGTVIVAARYGNGIEIGAGDTLDYYTSGNLNIEEGTIEFWFKHSAFNSFTLFNEAQSPLANNFGIYKLNNNLFFSLFHDDLNYAQVYSLSDDVSWLAGNWYFVAVTWKNVNSGKEDAEIKLYINGQEIDNLHVAVNGLETTNPGAYAINMDSVGNAFYLGTDISGAGALTSVMDQFRILDTALSAADIGKDYQSQRTYDVHFVTKDTVVDKTGEYGPMASFTVNYKVWT